MKLASVFKWFAQESRAAAELAHEKAERKIWCRLAEMWESAAARCRQEEAAEVAVYGQSEH